MSRARKGRSSATSGERQKDGEPVADHDLDTDRDSPPAPAPPTSPEKRSATAYVVAKGKSLSCRIGVIGEGKPIGPGDVHGGQAKIDELLAAGYVERG